MISKQSTQLPPGTDDEFAELKLGEIDTHGDTLAHYDGHIINVFGGIPEEVVVARIVRWKRKRKHYTSGLVTKVLHSSPHRISAPCLYFGQCTGCQWQHIDYRHQLELKRRMVQKQIHAFSELDDVFVSEPVPSTQLFEYRNHARFTARRTGALGYINRISRNFVEVDKCMIMNRGINEVLQALQGHVGETSQVSVRHSMKTKQSLIQPVLQNEEILIPSGQTHYEEILLGTKFRIASPSFFQVNTEQAEQLLVLVRDRLHLSGTETLVDAYAGVGNFTALLSSAVKKVIAIEESNAAVKDALINTMGLHNIEFVEGKSENVLNNLANKPDIVVLDPPRAGCELATLEAVIRWIPKRTVYVSCDPTTLARDLRILVQGGLRVEHIDPIDMFPQTHHIECVATLTGPG